MRVLLEIGRRESLGHGLYGVTDSSGCPELASSNW